MENVPVPEVIQKALAPKSDYTSIPADKIDSTFALTTNLASAGLTSKVLSFSDEWFAAAENLLTPTPPIRRPGVFVATGAWYDGWETRRHNEAEYDWVVIKLGVASGVVEGVEVDTAFFNGNHAEFTAVEGAYLPEGSLGESVDVDEVVKQADYPGWKTILPKQPCGPSQRHAWTIPEGEERQKPYTHVRLLMYPDGGIARLRLYGHAIPPPLLGAALANPPTEELSSALNGSLAISCSDQHFGVIANLVNPGRGKDMGDGWETARSRVKGHTDWAVIRLGLPGTVEKILIDTRHFLGNFPRNVRVHGYPKALVKAGQDPKGDVEEGWVELLTEGAIKTGPDAEHVFEGAQISHGESVYSHVRLTIIPDGGVKRIRIYGKRSLE